MRQGRPSRLYRSTNEEQSGGHPCRLLATALGCGGGDGEGGTGGAGGTAGPSSNQTCTTFCEEGLGCQWDSATKGYLCKPLPKTGEKCVGYCELISDYCMPNGTCGPHVAIGKSCKKGDNSCFFWATCTDGVCANRVALGEPCVVSGPDDELGNCALPLQCTNGKCATRPQRPVCP